MDKAVARRPTYLPSAAPSHAPVQCCIVYLFAASIIHVRAAAAPTEQRAAAAAATTQPLPPLPPRVRTHHAHV